jgi:Helitron helicase-like domain at N-terminus/PIF1-like helicase
MTSEIIRTKINAALAASVTTNESGETIPLVCLVCDCFISPNDCQTLSLKQLKKCYNLLKPISRSNLSENITICYSVLSPVDMQDENFFEITDCLLSPRATYLTYAGTNNAKDGFSSCTACRNTLISGHLPKFCIANNYCFGETPDCLLELTDIELAMITPVKTYGYCFSYTGGIQKQLKGSLSYYKISKENIIRAAAYFETLKLNCNVIVMMYGHMTINQYQKAKKKSFVRTEYVIKAIRWLMTNNIEWINLQAKYDLIVAALQDPLFIDNVTQQDSTTSENDHSVENAESFQIHYPDGNISVMTGGQEKIDDFQELVKEARQNGYDIEYHSNVMKEAVSDYKDNNLINACILQFPYGRGGMHEQRLKSDGSTTFNVNICEYIQYLSYQSQPQFHRELFTLILYNMYMKQMMVRTAGWKVRNKADANLLANELTIEDVDAAIDYSKYKRGTSMNENVFRGKRLLSAVDAISKAIPHTNEAAKDARRKAESLQHHFGCPTFFLTVTPDDDNHFLIQVLSRNMIDTDESIDEILDQQLYERGKKRTELRIKFPGICALFFELALNIIIREVIGWDEKKNMQLLGENGLFGDVAAFSLSVEEQGRRTLHAHILLWVTDLNKTREGLFSTTKRAQEYATTKIVKVIDSIASSKCFYNDTPTLHISRRCNAFPHECTVVATNTREPPVIVSDQELRYLRCKRKQDSFLSYCTHCTKTWNSTDFLSSYLSNTIKIENFSGLPDSEVRRLKSMAIQYQKNLDPSAEIQKCVVDAAYNHHVHTASCFKRTKLNCKNSDNDRSNECRYKYPQREKGRTIIQNASENSINWYLWNGDHEERFIKEICVKRQAYDAFQNVSCPAISYSKLTCNTNISFVMPGPIAQYCVSYTLKGTQQSDTEEYELVRSASNKVLTQMEKYEGDASQAVRMLLASSFAHQSASVVGAAMAAYLTRNETRFIFSHSFVWCPLRDIRKLIHGGEIETMISVNNKVTFFQCSALHYLCRPFELNHLSAFEFYTNYEVINATSQNRESLLQFWKDGTYVHPSYSKEKNIFRQGVRARQKKVLVNIFQYDFPDTAGFDGPITDETTEINEIMEEYSELVLLLFSPYRREQDLCIDNSFTLRFRDSINKKVFPESTFTFLQNLQDCKSNSFRSAMIEDDLQRNTDPLQSSEGNDTRQLGDDDEFDMEDQQLEDFLNCLDEETDECFNDYNENIPSYLNCDVIRKRGRFNCGYENLPSVNLNSSDDVPFVEHTLQEINLLPNIANIDIDNRNEDPSQQTIVRIMLTKTSKELHSFQELNGSSEQKEVMQPSGSTESIIDWAEKSGLDAYQRRAFEIITGTFVLSFYETANFSNTSMLGYSTRSIFNNEKCRLEELVGIQKRQRDKQLILFLHGPAGSGKTAVIDLVVTYSTSYCKFLWEGFSNNEQVIVITAMTGVAATLIRGQTTHSALFLNQIKDINAEQIELWFSTRMLIIDEISFGCSEDVQNMDSKTRKLKQQRDKKYGGIPVVVFSGDLRQLEPVGDKLPLYDEPGITIFENFINCYIELGGIHRFKFNPKWGEILLRFRDGDVTLEDIEIINSRIPEDDTIIPEDVRYATYFNADRDAINSAIFQERVEQIYNEKKIRMVL